MKALLSILIAFAPMNQDRVPPHSNEAEQGVLGSIIWEPAKGLRECGEQFPMGSEVFYDLRHKTIYDVLVAMNEEGIGIDLLTLRQRLKDTNYLESIGGVAYLTTLQDATPSPANLAYYIGIVRDKHLARQCLKAAIDISATVYDSESIQDVTRTCQEALAGIIRAQDTAIDSEPSMRDLCLKSIDAIQTRYDNPGAIQGLATGIPDLDKELLGMKPGQVIVIAARPSEGKTALAMQIAKHVAIEQAVPAGVFELEVTDEELTTRSLYSLADLNSRDQLTERAIFKITKQLDKLAKAPLWITDRFFDWTQIKARAARWVEEKGVKLLVVDYVQLVQVPGKFGSQAERIDHFLADCKNLAKSLGVTLILVSQFNREQEREGNRKPRLTDLRGSGGIEQSADVALLIWDRKEDTYKSGDRWRQIELVIAKNKNGRRDVDVPLWFYESRTKFLPRIREGERPDENDIPKNRG